MSVTIYETKDSRDFDLNSKDGSASFRYLVKVSGESNPENALYVALLADLTNAPYAWNGLARGRPAAKPLGNGWYDVTLPYRLPEGIATSDPGATTPSGGQPPSPPPNQPTNEDLIDNGVTIDVGGKPPKLLFSKETYIRTAPAGLVAPDYERAICVVNGEPQGVEAPDPAVKLSITRTFDYLTWGYVDRLEELCWHTNQAPFYGRGIGELLLMGANGTVQKNGKVPMTFHFGVDRGENEFPISPDFTIAGPNARKPWHYVWVAYSPKETLGGAAPLGGKAIGAYVERLFDEGDYSRLGIG